jgi:hypothetical protein
MVRPSWFDELTMRALFDPMFPVTPTRRAR